MTILMFASPCDKLGRKEYDIDFGDRNIDYIIDAGANIGLFSLIYSTKFPNAKIIAVEPEECNLDVLKKNIEGVNNITVVNAGLWYRKTYLRIENESASAWSFRVEETNNVTSLQALSVADIMNDYMIPRVDLLKLDIEGSEYEVLSYESEKWIDNVEIIIVETHEMFKAGVDDLFTKKMKEFGFEEKERNGENRIFIK